jgi:hypothetical protein
MPNLKEVLEIVETFRLKANAGCDYSKGVADALEWTTGNRRVAPGELGRETGEVCDDVNHHHGKYGHDEDEAKTELEARIRAALDRSGLFRAGMQVSICNPRENEPERDRDGEYRVVEIFEPRIIPPLRRKNT